MKIKTKLKFEEEYSLTKLDLKKFTTDEKEDEEEMGKVEEEDVVVNDLEHVVDDMEGMDYMEGV